MSTPAATISSSMYGSPDSASIAKVLSEMQRLGFTQQQIAQFSATINNGTNTWNRSNTTNGNNGLNASGHPLVTVTKGIMYNEKGRTFGIWDGKDAYVINSKKKLVKNASWTKTIKISTKSLNLAKLTQKFLAN